MREMLFRGKRIDNGEWVYGNFFIDERDIEDGIIWRDIPQIQQRYGDHYQYFDIDVNTVGQFTGLTDKNGKEIYEGDIVRNGYTCHYSSGSSSDFYNNGTVFMDVSNGCWAIDNGEHDAPKRITVKMINERNIEVIGNIHDNPELLEESK